MTPITVSIIGAGNVAHHLVQAFTKNQISVKQVYNRTQAAAQELCELSGAAYVENLEDIKEVDILLIAVSDYAIPSIANQLPELNETIVAHTSGSVSIDVLKQYDHYGGFYPLQSFRKRRKVEFNNIPIFVSADHSEARKRLFDLARAISKKPIIIGDKERSILHLPAVIVNNFTNHLYAHAKDLCEANGLDFSLLLPLIKETVMRLEDGGHPKQYQTGPAIRNDQNTIDNHRKELESRPAQLELYDYLTQSIKDYHK